MENRFLEMDIYLKQLSGTKARHNQAWSDNSSSMDARQGSKLADSLALPWAQPFSAQDRVLVILIENGGVDLGIPALVDKLLSEVPGASLIPDSYRTRLVEHIKETIRSYTDSLLESAELSINRYTASEPEFFGNVTILRDSSSSYQALKERLFALSRAGKIVDLFILTHGSDNYISVPGGIDAEKIRAMKIENGTALSIRSVYMMNCVGSSLNQAWLGAGAKVSCGALRNNYLPEPSMFFFWKNWKAGQSFETAVTAAYRQTISLMNETVRSFVRLLPIPGVDSLAERIDFAEMNFVKDSAPVIEGQGNLTIQSDNLSFAESMASSLVTTVLPVSLLRSLATSDAAAPTPGQMRTLSQQGVEFIKQWEGFRATMYNDPVGHCTIGYGTLLHTGNCDGHSSEQPYSNGISEAEATRLLEQKAAQFQQIVNDAVKVALNQNQNDALVSFVYNIGGGNFQQSTLLRVLNQGNYAAVPAEIKKWTKARQNGQLVDLPGLVSRRAAEAELFQKEALASLLSRAYFPIRHSYAYHSPSQVVTQQSHYSLAQNPGAVIAGMAVADAAALGLATISIIQAQVSASQGSFTLSYDKAQRLLTTEARAQMPGSQSSKQRYSQQLFYLGASRLNTAEAYVIIEWEGNAYGEIGTPIIRRDLSRSTEWSQSSATITITKVDRIPLPETDPRTWPINYSYEGTYNPLGNGYFEFGGEFEISAFGGLKFNRHEVFSRALADWAIAGTAQDYVQKGSDVNVATPDIPQEQVQYLRTRLP